MRKIWMFLILLIGSISVSLAQEVANEEVVSDEDLTKFANVEVMTSQFVDNKTEELKNMILNNEVIDGGARYNEIKAAWGDEAKEAEINLTDAERAAYKAIKDFQDSLQQSVVEYKTELIKDDSILGVSIYNKVNGAVKEDPAMKEKLDQKIAELKTQKDSEKTDGQ